MCPSQDHACPIAVDVSDSAEPGPAPAANLIEELVRANHILFDQGVVDAFGHISVRHVLMRGHGSTVVGSSLPQAVYLAVYAEINARYQLQASLLGEVIYLTEGESRTCIQNVEGQVQRPWDLWAEQACAKRSAQRTSL